MASLLTRAAVAVGSFCFLLMSSPEVWARPLQIIHTNDLHSHLDHSSNPSRGGYAAVKAVIDQLKWDARNQGIETLTLDAGDFTEDSQYYLADNGLQAWKAMDAMGYDAVTIGNHDWLAGPHFLDQVVGQAKPSFAFLGANFIFDGAYNNLTKYMRQWIEVVRGGAKIAIYGLTTDDSMYSWMSDPGFVYSPEWEAQEDLSKLRARNDYVIALTHLGVGADKHLVRRVNGLDLIVGGHSHTTLPEPVIEKDPSGRTVPIVQTGMHGQYVGDLLVDVEPGKPIQILHYRLVPVYSDGPQDDAMAKVVKQARERLDADYGSAWLHEVVGSSEVPLENAYYKETPTVWSDFLGESMRAVGEAEATIDVTQFEGFDQPSGPITREELFVLYPRIFEFSERYGYTVWTAFIRGWVIEFALKKAFSSGLPLNLVGITCDVDAQGNAKNFKINGSPIVSMRNYKIAMPEGIVRGAFGISKLLKVVIKNAYDTKIPIWFATEQHLKQVGGVIKAPQAPPQTTPSPQPAPLS
jgi:5'-nucleotidase/UDP-sugar diphosphatase